MPDDPAAPKADDAPAAAPPASAQKIPPGADPASAPPVPDDTVVVEVEIGDNGEGATPIGYNTSDIQGAQAPDGHDVSWAEHPGAPGITDIKVVGKPGETVKVVVTAPYVPADDAEVAP